MSSIRTGYWACCCAVWWSRILPRSCAYAFGVRLADYFYRRDHAGREAVISNLRHIHQARGRPISDDALQALARSTFRHYGKYLVDFFRVGALTEEALKSLIRVEGRKYLDECEARGRGVIMVSAHCGNWELGGAVLSAMGYELHAVVLPYRRARLERLLNHCRARRGIRTIPAQQAPRDMVRIVQDGKIMALLADRDYSVHHHEIDFMGRKGSLPRGPAWLSVKTGAPVLPAFVIRQPDDSFVLRFHPPIHPEEWKTEDAVRDTIVRVLEEEISAHPDQWFIFEDFWSQAGGMRGHRYE